MSDSSDEALTSSDEALTSVFQANNLGSTGDACEGRSFLEMIRLLQPVLDHQVEVVALIEDLAPGVWVDCLQPTHFPVLLRHEFLVHRCYLNEQVVVGEIEVGCEPLDRLTLGIELNRKTPRLVVPWDTVEVEKECELTLTVVSKVNLVCCRAVCAQGAPASITPDNSTSSGNN